MLDDRLNSIARHPHFLDTPLRQDFANSPLGFLDIGARGGAHDLARPLAEITAVTGFEPDAAECQRLLQIPEVTEPWARFSLHPYGLSAHAGPRPLHLTKASTNASLLPPNPAFLQRYSLANFSPIGQTEVETRDLDSAAAQKASPAAPLGEFIKIDTQGTELEILQGGESLLKRETVAVVCEVSFFPIYSGQALFSEVEAYLRSLGFAFYGFQSNLHARSGKRIDKRRHATRERAMYADATFLRDPLDPSGPDNTRRQNRALFLCAASLGYFDFALELLENDLLQVGPQENESLKQLVASLSSLDPQSTLQELGQAHQQALVSPEDANIIAGRLVDRRRHLCDYDDVARVSQHLPHAR